MARIVIDPGHGGSQSIPNDSSWNNAVGPNGTLEKNLTLAVALRVHRALRAAGHDARLTRDADVNLRLRDRAKAAKEIAAHAFVSIHFNGSHAHNAQGTETLVHTNYSAGSARLSLAVQDALLPVTGLTDRNKTFDRRTRIKPQSLGVLRPDFHAPSTAACLVEVSFLDRADEETRLQSAEYLQKIAEAIAAGIGNFVGTTATPLADAGDAIELAALEATGSADVVPFLGLEKTATGEASAPEPDTADTRETVRTPPAPFAKAFIENSGPPLALIASAPPWPDLNDFVEFVRGLDLRYFSPDELLELGASNKTGPCRGKNTFPPRRLWPKIKNTSQMLDAIRHELGVPIRILSAYRSPDYNSCIRGEQGSLHLQFNAIDFTCRDGTVEVWRRVADRIRQSERRFTGGIGVYPRQNFIHIDTRGSMADWRGR